MGFVVPAPPLFKTFKAMKTDEITGIYERKLMRKLLQADLQTRQKYEIFIKRVAPILRQYHTTKGGVTIRDPELDRRLTAELELFRRSIEALIQESQAWAWALANEKTDEILTSFIEGMSINSIARDGLFQRNEEAFRAFQLRKYDGRDLSARVWDLTEGNRDLINYYLDNGLASGRSSDQIAQDVREMLKEPDKVFRRVRDKKTGELKLSRPAQAYNPGRGVYRSSVMNARRLTRTEVNMAYRASDHDRWNRLDFILGIEIKLSKSHAEKMPEGDICDEAAGRYPKEFKFVGFHPLCYCYAVPVLPSKTDFVEHLTEGAPITGHVSEIPEGLKEWVASNRDRVKNYKSQPFWVEDNFKDGRIDKGLDLHDNNRNRAMTASVTP